MLRLSLDLPSVSADIGRRKLRGIAVPWNVDASVSTGQRVRFLPGSVDMTGAPVVLFHDEARPVGKVIDAADTDTHQQVVAAISDVPDGDAALVLAADGALTGFSVGIEPTDAAEDENGTLVVAAGIARHLALVVTPAFSEARVSDVAAGRGQLPPGMRQQEAKPADPEPPQDDTQPDEAADTDTQQELPAEDEAQEGAAMSDTQPDQAPIVVAAGPRIAAGAALPTLGQYLFASIKRNSDPATWANMTAAIQAAGHTTTATTPGLIPEPIVGNVVSKRASSRPILEAFGPLATPDAGSTFRRPVISDPLLDAAAAAEKSDATDVLGVTDVDVTLAYVKRAINISAEAIAFTSPAVLDVAAADLLRAYARGTEKVAATALAAGTYGDIAVAADGADLEAGLYDGAAAIYGAVGVLPDTLVVAPDVWARLGGFVAADGRSLFPVLNPSNSGGTSDGVTAFSMNVLGLRVIVSWALAAGDAYLAASPFVETYEGHQMSLRADEPTLMGVSLGVGGAAGLIVLDAGAVNTITIAAVTP